jgi:hypothetical protein
MCLNFHAVSGWSSDYWWQAQVKIISKPVNQEDLFESLLIRFVTILFVGIDEPNRMLFFEGMLNRHRSIRSAVERHYHHDLDVCGYIALHN